MNVNILGNHSAFPLRQHGKQIMQGRPNGLPQQLPNIDIEKKEDFFQPSWAKVLSFEVPKTDKGSQFIDFTGKDVSAKAQEIASMMQETPVGVEINLVRGMSMQQIANVCGGIGKQMDDALAAGEISEQEYNDLSKALDSYTSFMTEKAENKNAMLHVFRQTDKSVWEKAVSGASKEDVAEYAQQIKKSWPDQIRTFLKDNSYDRTILNQMIADVRNGKSSSSIPDNKRFDSFEHRIKEETAGIYGVTRGKS